ncbi:hypothetical protein SAMN05216358_0073 [Rhizobium sp. AN5]|uniref:hypothetical protein n=1 Tax=Rhizobium sp. AN5 TaxID=1855304 RepID=UPI000BC55648|nr:hypothetical protein [Rhizobium sp. AN5]SOC90054.1 hypothetical protein SAMN05216358_0073 [Rhizobium sp. AN5]
MSSSPERIIAAAINFGAIISLPPPARHHTIIQTMDLEMQNLDGTWATPQTQGFLTDTGRFVNRVEAYYLAIGSGQLKETKPTPQLYSEDLW